MNAQDFKQGQQVEMFEAPEWFPEGRWVTGAIWFVDNERVVIKWSDLPDAIAYSKTDEELSAIRLLAKKPSFLWSFIHNVIAHPLLVFKTKWADRFHDWTAEKI
jgi:hypothetical protein